MLQVYVPLCDVYTYMVTVCVCVYMVYALKGTFNIIVFCKLYYAACTFFSIISITLTILI